MLGLVMWAIGLDIQGDATFADKVGQMCLIVDDLMKYGPDALHRHAPTLQEAARRIWFLAGNMNWGGMPTFDAETWPAPIDTPEREIYQLAQDETGGSGGDDGVVDFGDTQDVPTTQREVHWDTNGEYIPETQAIVDRFRASNITRDRRTEPLRWGELFDCGLIRAMLIRRGGPKGCRIAEDPVAHRAGLERQDDQQSRMEALDARSATCYAGP
jgi:hypothetical protein